MTQDSHQPLETLQVDGGMTNSDVCMQLQADILGIPVRRPAMKESTALGSAICAGIALKLFGWDIEDLDTLKDVNVAALTVFRPAITEADRASRFAGWNRAVDRSRGWKAGGTVRATDAFGNDSIKVSRGG